MVYDLCVSVQKYITSTALGHWMNADVYKNGEVLLGFGTHEHNTEKDKNIICGELYLCCVVLW